MTKTAVQRGAATAMRAVLALMLAFALSTLGVWCVAFAADASPESSGASTSASESSASTTSESATSASAASASAATASSASAASASASSATAEPSGHQSIVYATDETNNAVEQIEDDENALSSGVTSTWSIIDLACAIASLAFCIALLGSTANKRIAGAVPRSRSIMGGISAALAFVSIVVLAMTQDFAMPASVADELSFLFVAILAVEVILFAVSKLRKEEDDGGDVDVAGLAV